jgi:hypothetical protein
MLTGSVSKQIPFIKKISMGILYHQYTNKDTAIMTIKDSITRYYKSNYSTFFEKNTAIIDSSIQSLQKSFIQNNFPGMKVTYAAYPDHIGHMETNGCFRCHNDSFKSEKGRVISKDCNLCHSIVGQGKPGAMQMTNVRESLAFVHPVDINDAWKEMNCSECHKIPY